MNSKQIIDILKIVGLFWIANFVMDRFDTWFGVKEEEETKERENQELHQVQSEIVPSELTYQKSQYSDMADAIYSNIQNTGLYEDEEATYPIFRKLKTNSDWLQLKVAYGKRPVGFPFTDYLNLVQTIQAYFSEQQVYYVNRILADKRYRNIKYRI
jgi:hypothetical protein